MKTKYPEAIPAKEWHKSDVYCSLIELDPDPSWASNSFVRPLKRMVKSSFKTGSRR
jgi:hypothetical protein